MFRKVESYWEHRVQLITERRDLNYRNKIQEITKLQDQIAQRFNQHKERIKISNTKLITITEVRSVSKTIDSLTQKQYLGLIKIKTGSDTPSKCLLLTLFFNSRFKSLPRKRYGLE